MKREKILVVEDDSSIRRVLVIALKSAGYEEIEEAATGPAALEKAFRFRPHLVLLDLMLPELDGLGVLKALRANPETSATAVIILTAKSEERDIVAGLDAGADDYVTKPFSKDVLLARMRAVLRKEAGAAAERLALDGLTLDDETHRVALDGEEVKLTLTEYRILETLLRHPGRVFSRSHLIDEISGGEKIVTERTIDVQLVGLRRKLGAWAERIETIRGVGYRLDG